MDHGETITVLKTGDSFGEKALMNYKKYGKSKRTATVIARENC